MVQRLNLRSRGRCFDWWSDEELQILKDNYPTMGAKGVVKLFPNRNINQVVGKA